MQAFDFRFVTVDDEKVKSLHFFSAFLSQRFVAFYIQRIALGIIRCCTFIVHSNHNFLPHQNIPHSSPFSAGTRARPRSPRTTEWRRKSTEQSKVPWNTVYSTAGTNDTIGLLSPTQFSLRSHSHGITNASSFLPLGSNSFNSTLNPFWPVQFEDERYKTSSEGLFQKICFLFKRLK